MPHTVTITGTRSTGHRPLGDYRTLMERYVRPFVVPDAMVYLGGATGIDSLALLWLADQTKAALTVAVPAALAEQPADARHAIATVRAQDRLTELVELGGQIRTEGFHARNRWMVDRSGFVIGFPLASEPERGGTNYTLRYAASQGKPRLVVPV